MPRVCPHTLRPNMKKDYTYLTPVYLVTNHVGFYERYGWEFFCMVQGDGESYLSRMYIHY